MPMRKYLLATLCLPATVFSLLSPLPSFAQTPPEELAPVVVTATRQEMRANEVLADVTVIEREEIERAGQGTITDLLSRQSGVQVARSGGPGTSSNIYLRGANYNQTKIMVDGIAINSIDLSASPLRYLSLSNVERIEILRGPATMLYGADALGGVINIITRRGQQGLQGDAFVGYGSHNTSSLNAGVSGGNEHWRFRVTADHFETSGISTQHHATNKDADKDAYRNTGGAASLSFLPTKNHEIGVSYRQNEGLSHYDSGSPLANGHYDERVRFRVEQWQIFSKNRFLPNWTSTLQYGGSEDYQKDYSGWGFPPIETITFFHTRNNQVSWQNDIDLPLGKALLMAEHFVQKVKPHGATYQGKPEINNTSVLAGWTANTGKHRWQINVRYDEHSEFGGETTYAASYGYQLLDALRAHVSYGTAFRAPTIVDLYRHEWGGNPDLKPEEAKNTEVGLTWEKGAHTASAVYYRNHIKGLIVWQPISLPPYGRNENVGKALLEGVTLSWRGTFDAWRLSAHYDWLNAQNRTKDPDGIGYERLGRRAPHSATFGLNYVYGKLDVGVEQVIVGSRYDRTYKKNVPNKEELGGYGLTNLTARYALNKNLSLEGRIDNLFDKKYEHARGYNTLGFNGFLGLRYSPR